MRHRPEISVIVPVYNGLPYLRDQMESLLRQELSREWEILYVDNGSRDGSRELIEKRAISAGGRIRLIDGSQKQGQVYARNLGVARAEADILAFNDQDDIQRPNWLDELTKGLDKADAVGGFVQVTTAGLPLPPFNDKPELGLPRFFGKLAVALGTNFAIHRSALEKVGGWQDLEGVFAGEDVDLCIRLALGGCSLTYAPKAQVMWRSRRDARGAYRQGFAYGRADVLLFVKYRRQLGFERLDLRSVLREWKHVGQDLCKTSTGQLPRAAMLHKLGWKMGRLSESVRQRVAYL